MRRHCALALALVALTTACTRVGGPRGGANAWTQHGHLRLGASEEPDSLNKLFANTAASDETANLLFAPVFRFDDRGELYPELATAVPTYANGGISRDGKTVTLHLRKNVTWADGAPLDGRDIRFTWRAVMNPRNNVRLRAGWDEITRMELPDAHTVVVHLRAPDAGIIAEIFGSGGGSAYPPLPEHVLAKLPDLNRAPFNAKPLASGPFVLRAWNHGSSLDFEANPRYWRGAPKLASISYRIVPSADTLFNQLHTHEIDVYFDNVSENQIGELPSIAGIRVQRHLIANWRHLEFNTAKPFLHDVRVRRAIAEAVDWNGMNRRIYHGYNLRATSDIFPLSWAAPSIPPYPFDPAGASRMLDAAGWIRARDGLRHRGGVPLHLSVSTGTNRPANVQAEVQMQQELRAVGIDLEIKNYPVSFLFAQNGPLYGGKYDMSWSVDTNGPEPDNQGLWSGRFIPPHGANTSWLDDPVINATSAAAIRTFDRKARKALYQREEERIHALVPAVFLYWQYGYAAYNSDLKNYRPAPYIANAWNAWEWEI